MNDVRLITLDPGHFHAALVQKEMYPGVAPQVHVYAPLGADLAAHIARVAAFNGRAERPTAWELEIHAGADFLDRALREKPGNVAVLSGRNRGKIDRILAAVKAGLNVLADKPWVIEADDLPKLDEALRTAEERGLVAYDIMTERYEITSILQREFVQDRDVFGQIVHGTPTHPGVYMKSVHFLSKLVAGVPLRRPAWFFDVAQQGEGLTDVGTHLVDLVPWILFPGQPLDAVRDVAIVSATRKPTTMTAEQFGKVTGEAFPPYLAADVKDGKLDYFCNTFVTYTVRGVHVQLDVLWEFESPGGSDTHFAAFGGSRSRVEVRQGKEQNYRPELFIIPNNPAERSAVQTAVERRFTALQPKYPGLGLSVAPSGEIHVRIPDTYRTGHEAHFGEVTRQFLEYLKSPGSLPAWERPNMLAKYHTTTQGVRLARGVKP